MDILKNTKKPTIKKILTIIVIVTITIGVLGFPDKTVLADVSLLQAALGPGAIGLGMMGVDVFEVMAKGTAEMLIKISGLFLTITGKMFDYVVDFTILNMAQRVGNSEGGLGASISASWASLRDIANMLFIFVLLYVAFKAIFDLDFGSVSKSIRNIIIVALLINFSLFFSKVVIDASNIVSIGFYNSIVTANTRSVQGEGAVVGNQTISTGYMRLLGLTKWFDSKILEKTKMTDAKQILAYGILTFIFMMVVTVVLLIATIMLLARFVMLIFIMILSPLALIAIIVPGMRGYFDKWFHALIDQSFFAPVFLALTWVVFKIASTPGFIVGGTTIIASQGASYTDLMSEAPSGGVLALVLNYALIIGFTIASLVISKQMASRTAGFTAISGGIGAGAIGGAAILGRQTIGRGAKMLAESSKLRDAASAGKWYSGAARAGLWTADKGAGGSFDLRATDTLKKVPGLGKELDLLGKAGGKGGFVKAVEQKADDKAKYAKRVYGQTATETEKARELEIDYNKQKSLDEIRIKTEREKMAREKETIHNRNIINRDRYFNDSRVAGDQRLIDIQNDFEFKKDEYEKAKKSGTKTKEELEELMKARDESRENMEKTQTSIADEVFKGDVDYVNTREAAKSSKEELRKAKERLKMNKENKFDDNEYLDEVQNLKKEWVAKKEAGKRRMIEFADRVEKGSPVSTMVGGLAGGALGTIFGGPIGTLIGAGAGAGGGSWAGGKLPKRANWAGNTEAGRKIRAAAEGRDKKDPKKLKKEIDDLFGIKNEEGDGQSGDEGNKKEGEEDKDKKKES